MKYSCAKQSLLIVCALSLFALFGCSPGGDPALIGKWQAKGSGQIMEIRQDGTWVEAADKDAQIIGAKWEWIATNRIRLTITSKLVGQASGEMQVSLNGDTLVLRDQNGTTEYMRVR